MIHLFKNRKRILFFPTAWANSVSRWLLGVHSPSGTIAITNTSTPGDGRSVAIDVNVNAIRRIMAGVIDDHDITEREIKRTKDIIHGSIDGTSIIYGGEHVSVSMDWLKRVLSESIGGVGGEITHDQITDWGTATAGFLTDDDYAVLSGAITDLTTVIGGIMDEFAGCLTADDIGVTVAEQDHVHTTADISDWGTATANFLTNADMSAYALDADLYSVEQDVADLADFVESMDDDITDLVTWHNSGKTGSFTVVTGVEWTGTVLRFSKKSVTFTNGLITAIGADSYTTIDTPVVFEET